MLSELWCLKSRSGIMSNIKGEWNHICNVKSFILCESGEEAVRSLKCLWRKIYIFDAHQWKHIVTEREVIINLKILKSGNFLLYMLGILNLTHQENIGWGSLLTILNLEYQHFFFKWRTVFYVLKHHLKWF